MRSLGLFASGLLCALLAVAAARADSLDRTLDISAQVTSGLFLPEAMKLRPTLGDEAPAAVADHPIQTRTRGILTVGGARLSWALQELRFGIGAGAGTLEFSRWTRGTNELSPERAFALPLEAWGGYSLCCKKGFRPYVDLRMSLTFLMLRTEERDSAGQRLGTTFYGAGAFSLAPRFGVRGLLSNYFFADVGASVGLIGPETLLFSVAIGLPIPTSHL